MTDIERSAPLITEGTLDLLLLLPGRVSSRHSQRAYYRWIDKFLADVAGLRVTSGDERLGRMSRLPLKVLLENLRPSYLRAWLGMLVEEGHGKQGINQARAAIVTLASLLAEAGWLDDMVSGGIRNVRVPNAPEGQRPGRWLTLGEIIKLISAAQAIATTENQEIRNSVIVGMLCTMALRREELALARWDDLDIQDGRPVLNVHGKGYKTASIDVPKSVLTVLNRWRQVVAPGELHPPRESALVRRIWKGGRISKHGLTPDGVWLVINEAATQAGLGHVAPHDLRRSVAGALQNSGVPVEHISRLLRHSNTEVTKSYLRGLPKKNQGAIAMSDLLGLAGEMFDWKEIGVYNTSEGG